MTMRCTTASAGTGALPGEGGGSGGGGGGNCDGGEGEAAAAGRPPPDVAVDVEPVVVPPPVVAVVDAVVEVVVSVWVPVVEVETVLDDWVELRVEEAVAVVEVQDPPTGTGPTQTSEAAPGLVAPAEARTRTRAAMRTRADAISRVAVADRTPRGCRARVLRSGLMQRRLSSLGHIPHLNAPGGTLPTEESPCPSSIASRSPDGWPWSPGAAAASAAR
jgi:hypothetical protein